MKYIRYVAVGLILLIIVGTVNSSVNDGIYESAQHNTLPHVHKWVERVGEVAPTCTEDGASEYFICSCGRMFADSDCASEIKQPVVVNKTGHIYINGVCECGKTQNVPDENCSHTSLARVEGKAASCTSQGVEEYYICSCGVMFSDGEGRNALDEPAIIPPLPHLAYEHFERVEPTCETDGCEEYYRCICGRVFADEFCLTELDGIPVIEKSPHDLICVEYTEPTCYSTGNEEYFVCECGRKFNDESGNVEIYKIPVIDKISHRYIDGYCDTCGKEDENRKIDINGITFDDKTVTYNGGYHYITVSGELPDGASVKYESNSAVNAGVYEAKAIISGYKYNTLELKAQLIIKEAQISVRAEESQRIEYDGERHLPLITYADSLRDVLNVRYTIDGNEVDGVSEIGSYRFEIELSADNYEKKIVHINLEIYDGKAEELSDAIGRVPFLAKSLKKTVNLSSYVLTSMDLDFSRGVKVRDLPDFCVGEGYGLLLQALANETRYKEIIEEMTSIGSEIADLYVSNQSEYTVDGYCVSVRNQQKKWQISISRDGISLLINADLESEDRIVTFAANNGVTLSYTAKANKLEFNYNDELEALVNENEVQISAGGKSASIFYGTDGISVAIGNRSEIYSSKGRLLYIKEEDGYIVPAPNVKGVHMIKTEGSQVLAYDSDNNLMNSDTLSVKMGLLYCLIKIDGDYVICEAEIPLISVPTSDFIK